MPIYDREDRAAAAKAEVAARERKRAQRRRRKPIVPPKPEPKPKPAAPRRPDIITTRERREIEREQRLNAERKKRREKAETWREKQKRTVIGKGKKSSSGFGFPSGLARTVAGDVKQIGYGVADAAADYGTAIAKDVARPTKRAPFSRTGRLIARDALGLVGAAETAIPEPSFLPDWMKKEIIEVDPEKVSIRRGSGKVDPTDTARAKKFLREDPLIAGLLAAPVVGHAVRRGSRGALEGSIRRANPDLSRREVRSVARKESKMPGRAAAHGIAGGIPERRIVGEFGEARGRPLSRHPIGRAGQRGYDRASEFIETRFGPGAKFSSSQRAARMKERELRRDRARTEAETVRLERSIRKGIRKLGRSRVDQEALIAVLEAPHGVTARKAVEMKLEDLRQPYNPTKRQMKLGETEVPQARKAQIRALEKALDGDHLETPEFAQAIAGAERLSRQADRSAKTTLGMSEHDLTKRRDVVARRYADRGLLPRQPATERARTPDEARARLEELDAKIARIVEPIVEQRYQEGLEGYQLMAAQRRQKPRSGKQLPKHIAPERRRHAGSAAGINEPAINIQRSAEKAEYVDDPNDMANRLSKPPASPREIAESEFWQTIHKSEHPVAKRLRDLVDEAENLRSNLGAVDAPGFMREFSPVVQRYVEQFGKIVDTDDARLMIPSYRSANAEQRAALSSRTQRAASAITDRVYDELLAQPPQAGRVRIMGGGAGAGKTAGSRVGKHGNFDVVVDTTLSNFGSATRKIDQALESGRTVEITYVYRDPIEAFGAMLERGSKPGGKHEGRVVPLEPFVKGHVESNKAVRKLAERYAGDDRVKLSIVLNRTGEAPRAITLPELPRAAYNEVRDEAQALLNREVAAGSVPEHIARGVHAGDSRRAGESREGGAAALGHDEAGDATLGGAASDEALLFGTEEVAGASIPARGRAFFPHRGEFETVGGGYGGAVGLPARGAVIGRPQRGRAFEKRRNTLRLYEEGRVQTDPRVLSNTVRQRARHERTLEARRYLYDQGVPIVAGDRIPDNVWLVRNPDVKPEKISDDVRAAAESPERFAEMWLYRGGDDTPPEWLSDLHNVRAVPAGVAKTLLSDVFASAPRGLAASIAGSLNSLARITTIYTPYAGARYIARNTPQNMILLALTQPKAFMRVRQSAVTLRRHDPDLYRAIEAEAGTVPAAAGLPELPGRAQNTPQRLEGALTTGSRRISGALGEVSDQPWRIASWLQYAREYGFKTSDEQRRLLNDPAPEIARVRADISQRVRDDMIDFDALPPAARESLSRYFFILPFVYGSGKWPLVYLREYPARAAIGALIAAQHAREETPGRKTSVLESGRTVVGGREVDLGWLNPVAPAAGTAEELSQVASTLPAMNPRATAEELSDMLSPQYRELIGRESRTPRERVGRALVPGFSTGEKIARGGGIGEQALRFFGSTVDYIESTPAVRAQREVDKEREEMASLIEKVAPDALVNGQLPKPLRQAFGRKQRIETIRDEAETKYGPGEDRERAKLYGELEQLVRWGAMSAKDAAKARRWGATADVDGLKDARSYLTDNEFDEAYLGIIRDSRKFAESRVSPDQDE